MTKEYDIESLRSLNDSYDFEHVLDEREVQKVNMLVEKIETSRSQTKPKPGDLLTYTSIHGDYSPKAFIESYDDRGLSICMNPCPPFTVPADDGVRCDMNGGSFTQIPSDKLKYVGKTTGLFKTWGHHGACLNGAVYFYAEVSQWEYAEPNTLYGEFTTKEWRKLYLYKSEDKNCLYKGEGMVFQNEETFQKFLKAYNGTVFKGNWENQIVVWCYKDAIKKIPPQQWEELNIPTQTRRIAGFPTPVKICKDTEKHLIITLISLPIEENSNSIQ